ncbi:MAG: dCTP deaminase [Proteobacteria bacterium]|nr:dCTP deaminase [Pseudomonadota bacterium]
MSIKSDNWIRRMAANGMIEPFEAGQVRAVDGRRIVSYGTSSYGYDVRCANEFKIFTNINSTIVDPKAFDPQSFVDVTADVAIIPPNSFALARTVEYFRIPRSVLTVCLGKCVTGDTRVVDAATGEYLPITEMRFGRQTLALDGGELRPARVAAFMRQGVKPVFELHTEAGLRIRATANHPFLCRDGWRPLEALKPGDRIAVAQEIPVFGQSPLPDWEADLLGLVISAGQSPTPGGAAVFTSTDACLVRLFEAAIAAGGLGTASSPGRPDDRPAVHAGDGSGTVDPAADWLRTHGLAVPAAAAFVPQAVFKAPREAVRRFLQALFAGAGGLHGGSGGATLEFASASRRLVEDVHHLLLRFGIFGLIREEASATGLPACRVQVADPVQLGRFAEQIGFAPGSTQQRRLESQIRQLARQSRQAGLDATQAKVAGSTVLARAAGDSAVPGASGDAGGSWPRASMSASPGRTDSIVETRAADLRAGPQWDTVTAIEPAGTEQVYDISVPRVHNFIANGIVVHNSTYARCGIIVNVTPLEPEWEGHVTLEFSNTTTLPAKIYANEGVAQMLFFESDEVCATSYKDRGGKYMGQRGVTLPKT